MQRRARLGWALQKRLWNRIVFLVLSGIALLMMIPFIWMISTSLKVESQVYLFPPVLIPNPIAWENYADALVRILPFPRFFVNSIYVSVSSTVGAVLTSSMTAFAFSRLRWPGRDYFFLLVLATMMVPGFSTIVPTFILFHSLGWIDTFYPLIIPFWCGGAPFYIFLMRQFFMTIPIDLDEVARMDGCSDLRIWWYIIVPLSKPAMATVAIYCFMSRWNDFFRPLIFLHSLDRYTVTLGLNIFRSTARDYGVRYHWLMAASVAALLPSLVVFFAAQKTFVQGVTMSGIKG